MATELRGRTATYTYARSLSKIEEMRSTEAEARATDENFNRSAGVRLATKLSPISVRLWSSVLESARHARILHF